MSILFVMIPISLALVVLAGWAFFWAVGSGQFDDLESPGWEVLREEADREVSSGQRTADSDGKDRKGDGIRESP